MTRAARRQNPRRRRWKSTRRVATNGVRVASEQRAREGHGVRVVRVEQRAAGPDLLQDRGARTRGSRPMSHGASRTRMPSCLRRKPSSVPAPVTTTWLREAGALQLAGEQQHLALPAAPLAAGRHMDDGLAHVSGRASTGRLPLSRRRT